MTNDLIVRIATPSDADELSALMRRTFVAANGHCSSAENIARFLETTYSPTIQAAEIADSSITTLIAVYRGQWAGFVQVRRSTPTPAAVPMRPALELGRIYLEPRFQGLGVGSALMANVRSIALSEGAKAIWLNVWQEASDALRFYDRQGFRVLERSEFVVGDDVKDDWLMCAEMPGA